MFQFLRNYKTQKTGRLLQGLSCDSVLPQSKWQRAQLFAVFCAVYLNYGPTLGLYNEPFLYFQHYTGLLIRGFHNSWTKIKRMNSTANNEWKLYCKFLFFLNADKKSKVLKIIQVEVNTFAHACSKAVFKMVKTDRNLEFTLKYNGVF